MGRMCVCWGNGGGGAWGAKLTDTNREIYGERRGRPDQSRSLNCVPDALLCAASDGDAPYQHHF